MGSSVGTAWLRSLLIPARIMWEVSDRHRILTLLAAFGLALGATMAIFGLPPIEMHGPYTTSG